MNDSILKQKSPVASADERLSTDDASGPSIEGSDPDAPEAATTRDVVATRDDAPDGRSDHDTRDGDGSDHDSNGLTRAELLEEGFSTDSSDNDDGDCCLVTNYLGP